MHGVNPHFFTPLAGDSWVFLPTASASEHRYFSAAAPDVGSLLSGSFTSFLGKLPQSELTSLVFRMWPEHLPTSFRTAAAPGYSAAIGSAARGDGLRFGSPAGKAGGVLGETGPLPCDHREMQHLCPS